MCSQDSFDRIFPSWILNMLLTPLNLRAERVSRSLLSGHFSTCDSCSVCRLTVCFLRNKWMQNEEKTVLCGKTGSISRLPAENCVDVHLIRGYLLIAPHLTNDFLQCLNVHITRVTFPPLPPPSSLFVAKCQIQLNEWRCHSAALATAIISVHAERKPAACKKNPH